MEKLSSLNNYVYEEYKHLPNRENLSLPLLISSEDNYINNLKRKVLYIGQETNTWMNYSDSSYLPSKEEIEKKYYNFLKEGARNRDFWKFIRNVLEIDSQDLVSNVIWNNVFISGNRRSIGHPSDNDKLNKLSLEYLVQITKLFNPEYIIFVCGPKNPYYSIVTKYLIEISSNLVYNYPTLSNPIVTEDNIIWTYHPAYQNRSGKSNEVLTKTKELVNKYSLR